VKHLDLPNILTNLYVINIALISLSFFFIEPKGNQGQFETMCNAMAARMSLGHPRF